MAAQVALQTNERMNVVRFQFDSKPNPSDATRKKRRRKREFNGQKFNFNCYISKCNRNSSQSDRMVSIYELFVRPWQIVVHHISI